jgi:hypothetical protein
MKLFSEQELMQFEANSRFIDKFCSAVQTAEDMVNSTKWLPAGSYNLSIGKITVEVEIESTTKATNALEKPLDIRYTEI